MEDWEELDTALVIPVATACVALLVPRGWILAPCTVLVCTDHRLMGAGEKWFSVAEGVDLGYVGLVCHTGEVTGITRA